MPRETVVHGTEYVHSHLSEDGRSGEVEHRQNPDVNVNWNRDGEWVQLAVTVDRRYLEDLLLGPVADRVSIPTEVLTRQQINHLIRTLRRARDAAYGSDE